MLSIEARSALRRIRARVADGDWIKGARRVPVADGKVLHCLMGHLDLECGAQNRTFNELRLALGNVTRRRMATGIVGFNDYSGTKREDIISVIDEALAE